MSQVEQQYSRPQRPTPAEPRRLVAHADLAQLDPGAEGRRQVAHQLAEVDPLLGGEVDGELVAVPLPLGVADLHQQAVGPHPLDAPSGGRPPPSGAARRGSATSSGGGRRTTGLTGSLGRLAADRAPGAARGALLGGGLAGRRDPAEVLPALRLDDHRVAHSRSGSASSGQSEVGLPVALEADFDGLGHQASVNAPIAAYFSAAAADQLLGADLPQLADVADQGLAERLAGRVGIQVGAAQRLRDDLVDDLEPEQVVGRELQRLGGALPLAGVLPQDRGAALGRDHRVDRVLQHEHPVGHAERQRAAGAALADHHGHDRASAAIDISRMLRASASDCPRSSAPRPG